jgi:hypothetical protein
VTEAILITALFVVTVPLAVVGAAVIWVLHGLTKDVQ